MEPVKVEQSWSPVHGRGQEYAAFMAHEFHPRMKDAGLPVVSGWYTLVGLGPRILMESSADSLASVEQALGDERLQEMLNRFMNLVAHYASSIFVPVQWMIKGRGRVSFDQAVKFVQVWDILPRQRETYDRFIRGVYLPKMEAIGLQVTAGWNLMLGAGSQVVSESYAPDLSRVAKALSDERYLQLITGLGEMVTNYGSRISVRHQSFLEMLHKVHGKAIRAVSLDELHPMVGPSVE